MRQWLDSLAPRERIMVLTGIAVVAVAIVFFGVWQPLDHTVTTLTQRVQNERDLLQWLQRLEPQVRALRQATATKTATADTSRSLLSIVDRSSKAAGLGNAVSRIQPDGSDRARVWLESAKFDTAVTWLTQLHRKYAITVVSAQFNRSKTTGQVSARLNLERAAE